MNGFYSSDGTPDHNKCLGTCNKRNCGGFTYYESETFSACFLYRDECEFGPPSSTNIKVAYIKEGKLLVSVKFKI